MQRAFALLVSIFLMTAVGNGELLAQTELEIARASLRGIEAFGVSVDVETSASLVQRPELDVSVFTRRIQEILSAAELNVLSEYDGLQQPFLYTHINAMEAAPGLVPFSVQVQFKQPVYLDPDGRNRISAATWEDSFVGLVSLDRLDLIGEALVESVALFVEEFKNP
jgi:hypothetical protein